MTIAKALPHGIASQPVRTQEFVPLSYAEPRVRVADPVYALINPDQRPDQREARNAFCCSRVRATLWRR